MWNPHFYGGFHTQSINRFCIEGQMGGATLPTIQAWAPVPVPVTSLQDLGLQMAENAPGDDDDDWLDDWLCRYRDHQRTLIQVVDKTLQLKGLLLISRSHENTISMVQKHHGGVLALDGCIVMARKRHCCTGFSRDTLSNKQPTLSNSSPL